MMALYLGTAIGPSDVKNDVKTTCPQGEKEFTPKLGVVLVVLRLLIYPFIGIVSVLALKWLNLVQDPLLLIIGLLSFSTPSANQSLIICSTLKCFEEKSAKILVYMYLICPITLAFFMAFYLNILA
jgi:predicted permease